MKHALDQSPVYGSFGHLTLTEISHRIDFVIENGYLEIDYNGKLPVIVYTEKGWEIERETYAEELLQKLTELLRGNDFSFVAELKGRNRGMILLLIGKISKTNNPEFIPLLRAWQTIEYKKVRDAIQGVLKVLCSFMISFVFLRRQTHCKNQKATAFANGFLIKYSDAMFNF